MLRTSSRKNGKWRKLSFQLRIAGTVKSPNYKFNTNGDLVSSYRSASGKCLIASFEYKGIHISSVSCLNFSSKVINWSLCMFFSSFPWQVCLQQSMQFCLPLHFLAWHYMSVARYWHNFEEFLITGITKLSGLILFSRIYRTIYTRDTQKWFCPVHLNVLYILVTGANYWRACAPQDYEITLCSLFSVDLYVQVH